VAYFINSYIIEKEGTCITANEHTYKISTENIGFCAKTYYFAIKDLYRLILGTKYWRSPPNTSRHFTGALAGGYILGIK